MHRQPLISLLQSYQTRYLDEAGFIKRAIRFIANNENCFQRELWPAHVTGSAWVVNPSRSHVLMLHHKKHDQWFQPGGHADGETDIHGVAMREAVEETGLPETAVRLLSRNIFDLDIHTIPEIADYPVHEHIDIRFLVEIDDLLPIPGNDESHQVLWIPLSQVPRYNNNRSTYRMVEKTRQMRPGRRF